jgi:hypothetical protein
MTDFSIPSMRYASFRLLLKKQFGTVLSIQPALSARIALDLRNFISYCRKMRFLYAVLEKQGHLRKTENKIIVTE